MSIAYGHVLGRLTLGLICLWFAREFLPHIPWQAFLKPLIAPVFDLIAKALAALFLMRQGAKNERAKQTKAERDALAKEAKKWANAGGESTPDRLRRQAARQRKDNS